MIIAHQIWQIIEVALFAKYMSMNMEIDVVLEIVQALSFLPQWPVQLIKAFGINISLLIHLEAWQDQEEC
jgi:hypothetical protein